MEPILLNVPEELVTERLRLRIPRVGDGPKTAAAVVFSRPELQPFMPWATDTYGETDGELWCRRAIARFILREQFGYSIHEHESDEFVGGLGPHRIDWKLRLCEVGYWLRTDRWGRGYMTEALNALVDMLGTIGLRRIEVRCDERNVRSAAVARRCGFNHDGTLPANALDGKGIPRTDLIFSRILQVPPGLQPEVEPVKSA